MDVPLTDPVRRACAMIAGAILDGPPVDPRLGEVCLAAHQVAAASRLIDLLERHGFALLADATGMGKTFVAIAVARSLGFSLVVGPASLRGMWRDAVRRTGVPGPFHSFEALSRGTAPGHLATGLVILDEAHHARNPSSRRYAMLADLAWGRRLLCLSATPLHNTSRDLRALFALSLGSRAWHEPVEALHRFVVRRTAPDAAASDAPAGLRPAVARTRWWRIAPDPATASAIERLPPAVPVADGGTAHALMTLGLVRAWASSATALRATLLRRLRRAAAMTAVLDAGRLPTRSELAAWCDVDGGVQLGFPEILAPGTVGDTSALRRAVDAHCAGIRTILDTLAAQGPGQDAARGELLDAIVREQAPAPVVAFTQFRDTAEAMYRILSRHGGVALVTGRGGRIASGRISHDEIVALLDDAHSAARARGRLPIRLLIATDVLSEGLSLRLAGAVVHLDLPWTVARLEQRVGRLQRPGSPHRVVSVHAIGPPIASRAMMRLLRVLRRKASLVAPFAGAGAEPLEELLDVPAHRGRRRMRPGDTAHAGDPLRDIVARWRDPTGPPGTGHPVEHWIAAGDGLPVAWLAACLVRHGGGWQVVSVNPTGVSDRPGELLRVVRLIEPYRAGDATPGVAPAPETHALARALVDRWLEAHRSRALIRPVLERPSASHAGVLRCLDALLAAGRRAERPVLHPVVARCRDLVLASRGVGAEHALADWLAASGARSGGVDRVRGLCLQLEARVTPPGAEGATPGSIAVILGLISHPSAE